MKAEMPGGQMKSWCFVGRALASRDIFSPMVSDLCSMGLQSHTGDPGVYPRPQEYLQNHELRAVQRRT